MSTWRDQLHPASFRGVPFHVDSDSMPAGRRTQTHEYPQRDKPLVEDLGRVTREIKLAAFVIGEDCYFQRDNLLNALDKPGAGELVHPWYGRLTATATVCSVSHERREGGMVRFDLVFVEDGEKVGTATVKTSVFIEPSMYGQDQLIINGDVQIDEPRPGSVDSRKAADQLQIFTYTGAAIVQISAYKDVPKQKNWVFSEPQVATVETLALLAIQRYHLMAYKAL